MTSLILFALFSWVPIVALLAAGGTLWAAARQWPDARPSWALAFGLPATSAALAGMVGFMIGPPVAVLAMGWPGRMDPGQLLMLAAAACGSGLLVAVPAAGLVGLAAGVALLVPGRAPAWLPRAGLGALAVVVVLGLAGLGVGAGAAYMSRPDYKDFEKP